MRNTGSLRTRLWLLAVACVALFAACDNLAGDVEWPSYTVVYHANDGTDRTVTRMYKYGTTEYLDGNIFDRLGHGIKGWARIADGEVEATCREAVNRMVTRAGQVIDLFAVWRANTHRVVYEPNGGEGVMEPSIFAFDEPGELRANAFTNEPYAFHGWAESPAVAEWEFADRAAVINLTAEDDGVVTLHALWGPPRLAIVFDANGGDGAAPAAREIAPGHGLTLPGPGGLSRAWHDFAGWNTRRLGDGIAFVAGDTFTTRGIMDVTLYAIWIPVIAPDGVTIAPATATVIRGGTPQQLTATVTPQGVPQNVDWTVYPIFEGVSISPTGLLTVEGTAVYDGATLTVTATVPGTALTSPPATVTVVVLPTGVTMISYASTVIRGDEPRPFAARVEPQGAPQTLVWVVEPQPEGVSINAQTGLLTVGPNVTPNVSFAVRAMHVAFYDYATVTVITPEPESVTLNPPAANVLRGATRQFDATMTGPPGILDEVTWYVYPAVGGAITGQGLLTVAANASGVLTVRARAVGHPAMFGDATVTVQMEEGFAIDFSDIRNTARDVEYAAPDISYLDLLDGQSMIINVIGAGDPGMGAFAWFFGGARITNADAGVAISNDGATLALDYNILNRIGRHRVTLEVVVDGVPFSRVITFYVTL